ncbi:MAG: hypothetical protein MUP55_02775 [Candidatus Aenigmarchaeota archaeon]|nr:hypothetical protein [Candidatus Aenigmarchaeota archaeon]
MNDMAGILYCKECGAILVVGGDKIEGTNVKHTIGTGKKAKVHEGYKKLVVKDEFDTKKFKTAQDWIDHLQETYKEKLK